MKTFAKLAIYEHGCVQAGLLQASCGLGMNDGKSMVFMWLRSRLTARNLEVDLRVEVVRIVL